jgi:CheY-like chemotaxis protein
MSTILVVEYETALRELLWFVLSERGYNVQLAGTGKGAREMLARLSKVDVLICDPGLPDVSAGVLAETVLVSMAADQNSHHFWRVRGRVQSANISQPYTFIQKAVQHLRSSGPN